MTAPAVVAWAAHLGWLHLAGSPLAFMSARSSVGEFVADVLPVAPARTSAFPLLTRIVVGFLTGGCIAVGGGKSLWLGGVAGSLGAIAGAFAGFQARTGLVKTLRVPDALIAIPEDVVAVAIGLGVVSRFY